MTQHRVGPIRSPQARDKADISYIHIYGKVPFLYPLVEVPTTKAHIMTMTDELKQSVVRMGLQKYISIFSQSGIDD